MNLLDDAADDLRQELVRRGWRRKDEIGQVYWVTPDGQRKLHESVAFREMEAEAKKGVRCDTHQPRHVGCQSCHRLWEELLQVKTLLRWEAAELSEGQAAKVLGMDRVTLRELRQSILTTLREEKPCIPAQ